MGKEIDRRVLRENEIILLLKKHPEGLGVAEIAEKIKVSRITMGRDLDGLVLQKRVYRRDIGTVRLHYHPDHSTKMSGNDSSRTKRDKK